MTLLISVLLVVAVLAVAVRIVQSRSTIGVTLFGIVVLGAIASIAWQFSDAIPQISIAQAAIADETDEESVDVSADGADDSATPDVDVTAPTEEADDATIEIDTSTIVRRDPPPPDWVESENVLTGETQSMAVSSGPHVKERDCRRSLEEELKKSVDAYVNHYLGNVYGDLFEASSSVDYDIEYINNNLVRKRHAEVLHVSFGPMHQMHALLEFDPDFRAELDSRRGELDKRWRQIVGAGRLTGAALAFGFILALLGVVFGYFRLDTATRGYYTARLQFASAVVILTLIVAGVLLARHIL
ncbi:MAG: hypothetical protein ISR77_34030 [Pirellulaceae bacterium]|nr:hypothetical protein [Pirellulaceae bacterium]